MIGRNESLPSPLFATLPCVKNTREVGATFVDENYSSKSVYPHSETERAYMHFLKECVLILIGNRTHVEVQTGNNYGFFNRILDYAFAMKS